MILGRHWASAELMRIDRADKRHPFTQTTCVGTSVASNVTLADEGIFETDRTTDRYQAIFMRVVFNY